MWIMNQDRDISVLIDNETKEDLHIESKFYEGQYFGEVIMFDTILLGTYDTIADADQIYKEIQNLFNKGISDYKMPAPADELEDLFQEG